MPAVLFCGITLENPVPSKRPSVRSLANLVWEDRDALKTILVHPGLDGGITDELTPVIAALQGAHRHNPELVTELLAPGQVSTESRNIELTFAGRVDLHILRLGPARDRRRWTPWRRRCGTSRHSWAFLFLQRQSLCCSPTPPVTAVPVPTPAPP